jgi:hypothetical protein
LKKSLARGGGGGTMRGTLGHRQNKTKLKNKTKMKFNNNILIILCLLVFRCL